MDYEIQDVIGFWYADQSRSLWFSSTSEFDSKITRRFQSLWKAARDGQLEDWKNTPKGSLALSIVLDQFPLNMYRGKAESFSTESQAIEIAKYAVASGQDKQLPREQVAFLYMPLMHSEDLADQDESVRLFESTGLSENIQFAHHHREIVRRFGRFPHRNEILSRKSTRDELIYLDSEEAFTG
ncbi:MAG: DUF924 domain-containing protein [Gammaproteobacteria bacterium]|nr:DUF924 domain-containing protein [Gammaproteobacteria bacterium]